MRIKQYIACLLIGIMGATFMPSTHADTQKKYHSPEDFLKQQKVIRVIANKFIGFGDIASAVNVMRQLRQLGFDGTFEVIYNNKAATILMFNLPTSIPNEYEDTEHKNRFIDVSTFLTRTVNHQIEPVDFSISSMAWNNSCERIINDDLENSELAKKMREQPVCTNNANFLNAKMFYSVSNWPMPTFNQEYNDDGYLLLNNDTWHNVINTQTYFATQAQDISKAVDFLDHTPQGVALAEKIPALRYVVSGTKDSKFDIMSVYGHGVEPAEWNDNGFGKSVRNILTIIAGARHAQLTGPAAIREKPLVMAVFYDYRKIAYTLNQMLRNNNFDTVKRPEGATTYGKWDQQEIESTRNLIAKLHLNETVLTANIDDPDAVSTLQQLKPGQILLLGMGTLPKEVKEALFGYSGKNAWPQVREGAGSASNLILTGKPHFRCGDALAGNEAVRWEMKLDYLINDIGLKNELKDFYAENGFCSDYTDNYTAARFYDKIGKLMVDAHDSNSAFSRYFQDIKADASKIKRNRVYQDMLEVVKVFNNM